MVEVLVSLVVLSILTMMTLEAFSVGSRSADFTFTQSRLAGEIRKGLERMEKELRTSSSSRITVVQPNVLRFQVPTSIANNGVITWSGTMEYSLGGVNNEQLLRRDVAAGTSTVIANNVTALTFTLDSNAATLAIAMTAQDATYYGTSIPVALTGTVQFRN